MQHQAFYFSGGPYQQVLQGLHDALSAPEAFIKLMGNAGSGKSALCEKLAQYMRRKGHRVVYFNYAIESPDMLRTMLARELDLPESTNFARLLEDALVDQAEKPIILIFDDAHLLTDITLIDIYRLAEVQVNSQRVLNILLCGEPLLDKRLLSNRDFKSLRLHISHRFLLEPMDQATLDQFFFDYLDKAGLPGLQLEPAAMNYFCKCCRGYPGLASDLCRLMVESRLGRVELEPVSRAELMAMVRQAPAGAGLPSSSLRDDNQLRVLAPLAAVLAVASVGFIYQQLQPEPESELVAAAQVFMPEAGVELAASAAEPADEPAAAVTVAEPAPARQPPVPVAPPVPEAGDELSVSDSSLALVTAAEIGISQADFVQPQYESLIATAAAELIDPAPANGAEIDSLPLASADTAAEEATDPAAALDAAVASAEEPGPANVAALVATSDPQLNPGPGQGAELEQVPVAIADTALEEAADPAAVLDAAPAPVEASAPAASATLVAAIDPAPAPAAQIDPTTTAIEANTPGQITEPVAAADATAEETAPPASGTLVAASNPQRDPGPNPLAEVDTVPVAIADTAVEVATESESAVAAAVAPTEELAPPASGTLAARAVDPGPVGAEIDSLPLEIEGAAAEEIADPQRELGEELSGQVAGWVGAWQQQSLEDYFDYYHPGFRPRYQDTVQAWRQNRRRVIGGADWIRLQMREFQLIDVQPDSVEVHFWLAYESPTYRDDTLKKLVLARDQGRWLILEEINLEVRS